MKQASPSLIHRRGHSGSQIASCPRSLDSQVPKPRVNPVPGCLHSLCHLPKQLMLNQTPRLSTCCPLVGETPYCPLTPDPLHRRSHHVWLSLSITSRGPERLSHGPRSCSKGGAIKIQMEFSCHFPGGGLGLLWCLGGQGLKLHLPCRFTASPTSTSWPNVAALVLVMTSPWQPARKKKLGERRSPSL